MPVTQEKEEEKKPEAKPSTSSIVEHPIPVERTLPATIPSSNYTPNIHLRVEGEGKVCVEE